LYLAEDLDLDFQWIGTTQEEEDKDVHIQYGIHFAKFGIAVEIPEGYCGILVERSSNWKRDIDQANKIGIIDSDYRGEIMAPIRENGQIIKAGERIAQLVIVPVFDGEPVWSDELEETDRGEGGFGSTGKH
jgi:dUTP pyrophosphatase